MKNKPYLHFKNRIIHERNKEIVIVGLVKHIEKSFGVGNVWYEKINGEIKGIVKPDYYLRIKSVEGKIKTWTIVVKTNLFGEFKENVIALKCPVVWSCKNNKELYPNSYLVASIEEKFKLIPFFKFWYSKPVLKKFKEGEKEVFLIDLSEFEWLEYNDKLKFWKV